ncbi:condensation domain-containing protein, partial [Salmonella enterica]|uniref:condensation domain-containing protein n=1 Tax=Salmonella enterica TaxID=28901 RepID=UPI001F41319D
GIVSEEQPFPFIYSCDPETAAHYFAQERIWFIEQYEGGTNDYHVPRVYQLRQRDNIEAIKSAIRAIVSLHDVLRSTINK